MEGIKAIPQDGAEILLPIWPLGFAVHVEEDFSDVAELHDQGGTRDPLLSSLVASASIAVHADA